MPLKSTSGYMSVRASIARGIGWRRRSHRPRSVLWRSDLNRDGVPEIYGTGLLQDGPNGLFDAGRVWIFDGKRSLQAGRGVVLFEVRDPSGKGAEVLRLEPEWERQRAAVSELRRASSGERRPNLAMWTCAVCHVHAPRPPTKPASCCADGRLLLVGDEPAAAGASAPPDD